MKFLFLLLLSSFAVAAGNPDIPDVELTWDMPSSREDGSALQPGEISHYNLYYRDSVIEIPSTDNRYVVEDVGAGLHTFEISTVDSDLQEGKKSQAVEELIPKAAVTVLTVTIKVTCSPSCVYEVTE